VAISLIVRKLAKRMAVACLAAGVYCGIAAAQESAPFSAVGIAVKASLLGAGAEVATPLFHRFNLRGGFNAFGYDRTFHKNGIGYDGRLQFRSARRISTGSRFTGAFTPDEGVRGSTQLTRDRRAGLRRLRLP
jgi:hypothetical protein